MSFELHHLDAHLRDFAQRVRALAVQVTLCFMSSLFAVVVSIHRSLWLSLAVGVVALCITCEFAIQTYELWERLRFLCDLRTKLVALAERNGWPVDEVEFSFLVQDD